MNRVPFARKYFDSVWEKGGDILLDESIVPVRNSDNGDVQVHVLTDADLLDAEAQMAPESGNFDPVFNASIIDATKSRSGQHLRQKILYSFCHLRPESEIVVVTHTRRGAKTHLRMLEEIFGGAKCVEKGGGGYRILTASRKSSQPGSFESIEEKEICIEYRDRSFHFLTCPSLFSKDRLDWGTRLLLDHLECPPGAKVLDLGCGYGALGIITATLNPSTTVVMADRDPVAVRYAMKNITRNSVAARVRALVSDADEALEPLSFDVVISHFPLHERKGGLDIFVRGAGRVLTPGGVLFGVSLTEYRVERKLSENFASVAVLVETTENEYEDAYIVHKAQNPL